MINGSIKKKELENKYVFWDIDGTLAPYRFNGHLADPDGISRNGMSLKEIEEGVFLHREPSKHMQNVVSSCNAKKNIILGHCLNEKEKSDKEIWLNKHYPMIIERLLVPVSQSKADTIIWYCNENSLDLKDIVFVDDVLQILIEAERKGIKSYHISSFLDWNYFTDIV